MKINTKTITLLALFCAMSTIGANIKLAGSIALDALPAFLAAMLMGGIPGAITGAVGHMLSASLAGFPFTPLLHIVIALEMAAICFVTGLMVHKWKRSIWLSAILAFVLNAFVSPAILIIWPGMGLPAYIGALGPLTLASAVNAGIAAILAYALQKPYTLIIKA